MKVNQTEKVVVKSFRSEIVCKSTESATKERAKNGRFVKQGRVVKNSTKQTSPAKTTHPKNVAKSLAFCKRNGMGRDVAIELKQMDSEVIELMINTVFWATCCVVDESFDPFPNWCGIQSKKKYAAIRSVLDCIPSVQKMKYLIRKRKFHSHFANAAHLHEAHKLLSWIITSHKGHIHYLPRKYQTKFEKGLSGTNLRLFKIVNSPEKEASFLSAKGRHKTEFLYHGSRYHSWHSILHNNLKNLSNTPQMVHQNASYGPGIYLTEFATTSLKYVFYSRDHWNKLTMSKI